MQYAVVLGKRSGPAKSWTEARDVCLQQCSPRRQSSGSSLQVARRWTSCLPLDGKFLHRRRAAWNMLGCLDAVPSSLCGWSTDFCGLTVEERNCADLRSHPTSHLRLRSIRYWPVSSTPTGRQFVGGRAKNKRAWQSCGQDASISPTWINAPQKLHQRLHQLNCAHLSACQARAFVFDCPQPSLKSTQTSYRCEVRQSSHHGLLKADRKWAGLWTSPTSPVVVVCCSSR